MTQPVKVMLGLDFKRPAGERIYMYAENPYREYDILLYQYMGDDLDTIGASLKRGIDEEIANVKKRQAQQPVRAMGLQPDEDGDEKELVGI